MPQYVVLRFLMRVHGAHISLDIYVRSDTNKELRADCEVCFLACFRPLKGYVIDKNPSGKDKYLITSFRTDHLDKRNDRWYPVEDKFHLTGSEKSMYDYIKIPCGKCLGCRLDYAKKWSERILAEKVESDSALFLTLTYDDDHIPLRIIQNKDFGEVGLNYSLDKRDLQLFWKRLRKAFPDCKLRYFCCGEYGTDTYRPHYHAIVFNLPILKLNLRAYKKVRGNQYWISDILENIWTNGFVVVGDFSMAAASYVARYTMKKANANEFDWKSWYVDNDIEPEFINMSRKPGIGRTWYDLHKEKILDQSRIYVGDISGASSIGRNRYYNNLLSQDFAEDYEDWKRKNQEAADLLLQAELIGTDLDELTYYKVKEASLRNRTKSLRRNEI